MSKYYPYNDCVGKENHTESPVGKFQELIVLIVRECTMLSSKSEESFQIYWGRCDL